MTVTFSKAVDGVTAANFTIPGVTVVAASLDSAKKIATLTVSGANPLSEYVLTATGVKVNAEVIADMAKNFTMPDAASLYHPTVTTPVTTLKADGATSTLLTFSLKDAEGTVITDAQDVEVAFTTTFGNLGAQRVTVQNGTATVMLTSEQLTADRTAQIQGQIVSAADTNLIGLKATMSLLMSPNPDTIDDTVTAASMTNAEAGQADRIVAYFNKDVAPADYIVAATGAIDPTKAVVTVRKGTTTDLGGNLIVPVGLAAVPGNTKALQIILPVTAAVDVLNDNDDVYVKFNDLRGNVPVTRDTTFKLTDARTPSMLSVAIDGLRAIKVTFSEPVESVSGTSTNATTLNNWSIDGVPFAGTIAVGAFNPVTGNDQRNVVTLTLPVGTYFTAGNHSVQAANIGDWASLTDARNIMTTQTLDFNIPSDTAAPLATVEVQSPEQYLITFNKDLDGTPVSVATALASASGLKLQKYNTTSAAWENYTAQPLRITGVSPVGSNSKFLVETTLDWTDASVYNTSVTNKNYFNDSYRLSIPANAVKAATNGTGNAETNLTLDGAMTTPDVTSPAIASMVATVGVPAGSSYDVTMSEPVKLSAVANTEGVTLAQGQTALPVPTAEFIKKDNSVTIPGAVAAAFVDAYNQVLRVTPVTPPGWAGTVNTLSAGDWTLVVRSISDDIGNTAASATKEFNVEGTVAPSTAFKILFAFADVDTDLVVEATDGDGDGDGTYDYVFVKFSKPVSTTGDFTNALKTSNYTLDGVSLPIGTQIYANIAGYDNLDNVTDSVTIRLPQGTLQAQNAPHVINVSAFLESATGEKLANAGERTLPYDNYVTAAGAPAWTTSMAADIAADLLAIADVTAAANARPNLVAAPAIEAGELAAFETAYNTALISNNALPASSLVKASNLAALNTYKAQVLALPDFATYMSNTGANFALTAQVANVGPLQLVVDGAAAVTDFSDATRYTVTNSTPATATIDDATGDLTYVADGTTTITILDKFWGVSDTVTITATGGSITTITTN